MILGTGVDIIEIARMERSIGTNGERLLRRIFTDREILYCKEKRDMYQHFAARFAAKEAVSKALATGLRGDFGWKEIEVVNDILGKPHVEFHGRLREKLTGVHVLLSLSHSDNYVVAMVIIEEVPL